MNMQIGFIGAGQMGRAMISGLTNEKLTENIVIHGGSDRSKNYAKEKNLKYVDNNHELVISSDVIILAFLPNQLAKIAAEIKNELTNKIVISVLGGISLKTLEELLGSDVAISRILPNTPVEVNQATIGFINNTVLKNDSKNEIKITQLLNLWGTPYQLSEDQFSVFSALCGSGPAFVNLYIDALAQVGVKYGLQKKEAVKMISQTMLGTIMQLEKTTLSPRDSMDKVASPGGSTIVGLIKMQNNGFLANLEEGIDATIAKNNSVD